MDPSLVAPGYSPVDSIFRYYIEDDMKFRYYAMTRHEFKNNMIVACDKFQEIYDENKEYFDSLPSPWTFDTSVPGSDVDETDYDPSIHDPYFTDRTMMLALALARKREYCWVRYIVDTCNKYLRKDNGSILAEVYDKLIVTRQVP